METLERTFAPLERYHVDVFGFCEEARKDAAYCRSRLGSSQPPKSKNTISDDDIPRAEPGMTREAQRTAVALTSTDARVAREDNSDGPRTIAGRRHIGRSDSSRKPTGFFKQKFSRGATAPVSTPTAQKATNEAPSSRPRRRLSKAKRAPSTHKRRGSLHQKSQHDTQAAAMRGAGERDGVDRKGVGEDRGKERPPSRSSEITYNEGRVMFGRRNSAGSID